MRKFLAAAVLAGFVTITGASAAMAETTVITTTRGDNGLADYAAYQRCRSAGGTDKFCGSMGGYESFR